MAKKIQKKQKSVGIVKLTEKQWESVLLAIPEDKASPQGGRPHSNFRGILDGILWIILKNASWRELPRDYPSDTTCWRWYMRWEKTKAFGKMFQAFTATLEPDQKLEWINAYQTWVLANNGKKHQSTKG
jgi:transposase